MTGKKTETEEMAAKIEEQVSDAIEGHKSDTDRLIALEGQLANIGSLIKTIHDHFVNRLDTHQAVIRQQGDTILQLQSALSGKLGGAPMVKVSKETVADRVNADGFEKPVSTKGAKAK